MMNKKFNLVQSFRGVLFLFILAFHCKIPFCNFGWSGVETFFIMSSFFMTRKYYNNSFSIKCELLHRIARLYPAYIILLIIALLFAIMKHQIPIDFPFHLLSSQNFYWIITNYKSPMQSITAHTWTLSIEIWLGLLWLFLLN